MSNAIAQVRQMVRSGRSLSAIVGYLRSDTGFIMTPFNFLKIFVDAVGMPLVDSRRLLEGFDADMMPLSTWKEIDRLGNELLSGYRTND